MHFDHVIVVSISSVFLQFFLSCIEGFEAAIFCGLLSSATVYFTASMESVPP